jgi:hypothetical protein
MNDNQIIIQNSNRISIMWVIITNIPALPISESEHGRLAPTKQINAINYCGRHW